MKIMVVGGGGREHAIIKKLKENKAVEKIYALPGNGGMAKDAECVNIGAKEIDKIDYQLAEYDSKLVPRHESASEVAWSHLRDVHRTDR